MWPNQRHAKWKRSLISRSCVTFVEFSSCYENNFPSHSHGCFRLSTPYDSSAYMVFSDGYAAHEIMLWPNLSVNFLNRKCLSFNLCLYKFNGIESGIRLITQDSTVTGERVYHKYLCRSNIFFCRDRDGRHLSHNG